MKHGKCYTRVYRIWRGIINRCADQTDMRYGGRGIRVCEKWKSSFVSFLEDMGEPSDEQSIERIDNDGDYCPENCKWATRSEQANNRSNSRFIEHNGKRLTATQWSRLLGGHDDLVASRIAYGWDTESAIETPLGEHLQWITHNGRRMTAVAWSRELGGCDSLVSKRIHEYGWTVERAVTTKARRNRQRAKAAAG